MTFRLRPSVRPARRTHLDAEERQQFLVTVGFLLVIGAAILLLGGAVALGYYNDHLKPVATVNGTGITQDAWIERTRIELFRIQQDEARVREAVAAGELPSGGSASRTLTWTPRSRRRQRAASAAGSR